MKSIRLFCFPYAGGSTVSFRSWQGVMPGEIQLCPVEYPGRGRRILEPLCTGLPDLLDDLTPLILKSQEKPFAFFGHSLGALVAFEMTRRLRKIGGPQPLALFVSGYSAPHLPRSSEPMHTLPEDQFIQQLREYNGTPEEVLQNPEIMEMVMPILRADFAVAETYFHESEPALEVPLISFGGLEDRDVPLAELEAWREYTEKRFQVRMFPGDHFFLHSAEDRLLGELIRQLQGLFQQKSGSTDSG